MRARLPVCCCKRKQSTARDIGEQSSLTRKQYDYSFMEGMIVEDRIIQVAVEIFRRKGFNNKGIQEILKAAVVSKGAPVQDQTEASFFYSATNTT